MTFGEWVRERRSQAEMSQGALAEACHTSQAGISFIENGSDPTLDTARLILAALGSNLAEVERVLSAPRSVTRKRKDRKRLAQKAGKKV